eukprot:TRINITY_DN2766_c0_g1_i7.p1 TRINITY_DN2766_c0_g1~~TRINITY_DN2766_c0_g1_i7.p1  ORF type:complete len:346 (-),score=67.82 TRINITY_DN2766_c0_g1_i7:1001-1930(-)
MWRGTACVACLEPQGAAPWHYCRMCGVHIHVKCAAEVAHRQKRGDDGGAGSGGSGGGGGGGGGIGGSGSAVACDHRAARDSGGDSSGSNGGAATIRRRGAACVACVDPQGAMALMPHVRRALPRQMRGEGASRHNLGDVYKIMRTSTCVNPAVRSQRDSTPFRSAPGLSHMLHTAGMAAATSGSRTRCTTLHMSQHDMACVYVLRTVYAGMGSGDRTVLYQWPRGARAATSVPSCRCSTRWTTSRSAATISRILCHLNTLCASAGRPGPVTTSEDQCAQRHAEARRAGARSFIVLGYMLHGINNVLVRI